MKPGSYGATDAVGYDIAENPVEVRDLHATLLNQLGFDHHRLNYPYQGLEQKITGVKPSRVPSFPVAESRPDFSRALTLSALAAAPAVLLLAAVAPWPWLAPFLGRFHPAVLHLPIALLLLAALLEALQLAGRGRWKFPVTLIWFLGTAGAVTAA
eukprot:gene51504-70121_t